MRSPLRSCPERPGPQVVLCLGMRSEARNGECLCSSRYARSSRWAELVAVVSFRSRVTERDVGRRKQKNILTSRRLHLCSEQTHNMNTCKGGWQRLVRAPRGSCQVPVLTPTQAGNGDLAQSASLLKFPPRHVCHAARRQMPSGPSQD